MDKELPLDQHVASGRLKGIIFDTLSEEDAVKLSSTEIRASSEVTDPALGLPSPASTECLTCGAKHAKECEGHFGRIQLPYTILNPYFIADVAKILNKICPACKSFRHDRDKKDRYPKRRGCKYCARTQKLTYPVMKFKVSSKDQFGKMAIVAEINEKYVQSCASDYWDIIPQESLPDESLQENRRVLSYGQVYKILKDVRPNVLEALVRRKSIFTDSILVTPNSHRVREFGFRITFDETTKLYKKLIEFGGTANEVGARVLDLYKVSKISSEKLSTTEQIYAEMNASNDASTASGLKHMKELLLGKRTDHVFRMVVVGDPKIKLDQIGIPIEIAQNLHISEHVTAWNWHKLAPSCEFLLCQKGELSVIRGGRKSCIRSEDSVQPGDNICRPLVNGDIVLINRPPSIHQHSLIALSVKILPTNSVLSINPLICSPFRGDFDGDCLHGFVPQSVDSRVELHELVSLKSQSINGQSGQNLLSLTHDSLTAFHLILEDGVFLNKYEMQQLQMFCPQQLQEPAIVKSSLETSLWTGKQLFSLLLPSGFEFTYLPNGVHITQGELITCPRGTSWLSESKGNLFHCLLLDYQDEALDFLYAAQEVLCEWLSTRGLSVSLSDLYLSSDPFSRKNLVDEVSYGLQEAERLSCIRSLMVDHNLGFLSGNFEDSENALNFAQEHDSLPQHRSAALSQASISAFKKALHIQNLVYEYASRENSFLAMLKAGSKGNIQKLVQHSMCLGLQHSLVPLSFRLPPNQLSCASWNKQKHHFSVYVSHGSKRCAESYIPCTVVSNSFLDGLNPLECFAHSLTSRDSSFSGNADISGTLTRKLMFFMRDLVIGYDGTVRNAYGDQVVQFSYCVDNSFTTQTDGLDTQKERAQCHNMNGGHPVGSLAACAISEAAYSALDHPVSALEPSPLLALKKVLECGVKKNKGDKTASLYLSKRLGSWANGFEYGALRVRDHLERLLFLDIVSKVVICFKPQNDTRPWVCHFHINKEAAKKRHLKLKSVVDALNMKRGATRIKSSTRLPILKINANGVCEAEMPNENDSIICIKVESTGSSSNYHTELDILRDVVIPFLLQTVIKGFSEFKKVDILWKEEPSRSKFSRHSSGNLYLRLVMSENCDRSKFWSIVKDRCVPISNLIDWERSHPDDIHDIRQSYGIDVAWEYFVNSLNCAISDTGKTIIPEHLIVTANCLSVTGEFVPLNAKGLAQQRRETFVSSPFSQACFSKPSDGLIKAAKMGQIDDLKGSLDALSWGKTPPIGTGCHFDIVYNGKMHEPAQSANVYSLLSPHVSQQREKIKLPVRQNDYSAKVQSLFSKAKRHKNLVGDTLSSNFFVDEIGRLSKALRRMLHEYTIDDHLTGDDKSTAMYALKFHPQFQEKVGAGAMEIKVGQHPKYQDSRCFLLVRTDGTVEDFSYHKCLTHALEVLAPQKAVAYRSKWLNGAKKDIDKVKE